MSRKRIAWIGIGVFALAVAGVVALGLREPLALARIGVGYVAQQTCTCLHVSGRPIDSCAADIPADAAEQFTLETSDTSVAASAVFGLYHAEAVYEDGFGCRLVEE